MSQPQSDQPDDRNRASFAASSPWTPVDAAAAHSESRRSLLELRDEVVRRPPPAKFAAIDVGTNSIHLVMVEITPDGDFRILGRDKEMVQLGKGGFVDHVLTAPAQDAGVAALKRFTKMARLKGIARLRGVTTSAVREAHNGGDFVERVRSQVGLDLHVLSAEEEARLIYLAVRHAVDLGAADTLIVDIGGGSVELIVGNAERPRLITSHKLGALRLAELYLHADPPTMGELKTLRRAIERELRPVAEQFAETEFPRCIATSGTFENLATVCAYRRGARDLEPGMQLRASRAELKSLVADLARMTRDQRSKVAGIDARRCESILPGGVLLLAIGRLFGVGEFEYCEMALREGIILDHIAAQKAYLRARAAWPDPRTRSVVQLAERFGASREHGEQVARLALVLFDQLASLHRLDTRFRDLLHAACLLHDVGYAVSQRSHHKHSYYLIRNGGLQGFRDSEIEIIANIARYHRKGRPRRSHYSWEHLDKAVRPAVRMLIVLLRLANALDRTHYSVVRSLGCRILDDRVIVRVNTNTEAELELWMARRIAPMFEREFGRTLAIEASQSSPDRASETARE